MSDDASVPRHAPGWYPDPLRRFELRFHNGTSWTADVAENGRRFVDPLGLALPRPGDLAPTNGAATTSMVLGILAVSIAWLPLIVVLGFVLAIAAAVFGVVGLRASRPDGRSPGVGRGRALAGLATAVGAIVAAMLGIYLSTVVLDVYRAYLEPESAETAVTDCTVAGSRATATIELTNTGDEVGEWSVLVGFNRPGTDNAHRTDRVEVRDLRPGATATVEAQRQVELDDVDCVVLDVTGPLPFGISLD